MRHGEKSGRKVEADPFISGYPQWGNVPTLEVSDRDSEGNLDTRPPVGVLIWMLLQDMVGWL